MGDYSRTCASPPCCSCCKCKDFYSKTVTLLGLWHGHHRLALTMQPNPPMWSIPHATQTGPLHLFPQELPSLAQARRQRKITPKPCCLSPFEPPAPHCKIVLLNFTTIPLLPWACKQHIIAPTPCCSPSPSLNQAEVRQPDPLALLPWK